MAAAAAPAPSTSPAAGKRGKLPLVVVAVVCIAAGAAAPMFVSLPGAGAKSEEVKKKRTPSTYVAVPVGDVVANLAEDRMNRYLRMKLAVKVEAEDEKTVTALVTKHKVALKSRLISHLTGKTLRDVSGAVGVNRLQREILERFDDILYPDGDSKVKEILFEEYVVQ